MKTAAQILFWLGILCIPLGWMTWYIGPELDSLRMVGTMENITDPALRLALQEAHAERLGLWVAVWPVTLLLLSYILEKKTAGNIS